MPSTAAAKHPPDDFLKPVLCVRKEKVTCRSTHHGIVVAQKNNLNVEFSCRRVSHGLPSTTNRDSRLIRLDDTHRHEVTQIPNRFSCRFLPTRPP